jgi:hypothetical protein
MYRTAITEFYKKGSSPELDAVVSDVLHRLRDPRSPAGLRRASLSLES